MPIHLLLLELRGAVFALLLISPALAAGPSELPDGLYAEIETPKGVITCELDYARAPLTVANFVGLAEGTLGPLPRKPFFDGLSFHRVVPNFVIQGGDPLGTGEGGPGYAFADEFVPGLGHDSAGVLSMANEGPDTNGSQFFITLAPAERLNYLHSVFGRVIRGTDIPPKVAQGDTRKVRIVRIGRSARAFQADESSFAALKARAVLFRADPEPGKTAHFDDPDKVLPADPPRARAFNIKLCNIERATGHKIYARIYATFAPRYPGDTPEALARSLAEALGLREDGILAVYFADRDRWVLEVGGSLARYFSRSSSFAVKGPDRALSEAEIADFLSDCRVREARYAEQSQRILATILQIPGQKAKISTDAILDGLLMKMSL